jgi:hypothetical protein
MPLLRGDLGLSTVQVGWIGGVRFLSLIALSLLGVVADRFGFPAAWAASAATLVVAVGLALSLPQTAAPRT